jgi:phage shock protein PspC (stress-responsive transcriptional regulator)
MAQIFKYTLEKSMFGVCSQLADYMNISTKSVRLSFVYASFFTLGSPIIFYLVAAFWLNVKRYAQERRTRIWDL